jgi:hypothetical protein
VMRRRVFATSEVRLGEMPMALASRFCMRARTAVWESVTSCFRIRALPGRPKTLHKCATSRRARALAWPPPGPCGTAEHLDPEIGEAGARII